MKRGHSRMMKLGELQNLKIGVLGDAMLDRYLVGKVSRVSPEAPIPVVNYQHEKNVLGGATNVTRNVCDFGAQAHTIAVVGSPSEETSVLNNLLTNLRGSTSHLVSDPLRPTTTKMRVLGNGQQIVRIDREETFMLAPEVEEQVLKNLDRLATECDAVIVADYAKGVITPRIVERLKQLAADGFLVTVDPHPKNLQDWSGVQVLKPNLSELIQMTGQNVSLKVGEDPRENEQFRTAVEELSQRYSIPHLLLTLSEHGMVYVRANQDWHWEPSLVREVFDVSGAGDTVISYFTLALAAGWSGEDATKLANQAASLVVQKLGTASLSFEELKKNI